MDKKVKAYMRKHPNASAGDIALKFELHMDEVNEILASEVKYTKDDVVPMFTQNPTMTAKKLAKEIGFTYQYVIRILDEAGVDFRRRTKQIEELHDSQMRQRLMELYNENTPLTEIQKELGVSHTKVNSMAKELGIELRKMRTNRHEELKQAILKLRDQGMGFREIANTLEISYNYALNLASKSRKKDGEDDAVDSEVEAK